MEEELRWVSVGPDIALLGSEMQTYANDLDEAMDALELIDEPNDDDFNSDRLREHLVTSAVIAYWRCFPSREDKPSLARRIDMTEMAEVHERSRVWRNRLVAHTDSGMKKTTTVLVLVKVDETIEVQLPMGHSVVTRAPENVLTEFADLVAKVHLLVTERVIELRKNLVSELSEADVLKLWSSGDIASSGFLSDSEWDPGSESIGQTRSGQT